MSRSTKPRWTWLYSLCATWYKKWYGVELNPNTEIQPLIGSKEGILHVTLAFVNPGEQVLVPNPGYPTYTSLSKILGAEVINYNLKEENNYRMAFVANCYRPLTREPEEALEVMREIEAAGHLPFTCLINNANLGHETTAEDVLRAIPYMEKLSELSGLPLWLTTAEASVAEQLRGKVEHLLPMTLQKKYFDLPEQQKAPAARPLFG